jgi:chain length determinant protein tyrosine kinase EpsG
LRGAVAKQYDLPHLLPDNQNVNSELVVAYEPFHRRAEELRALRTQLLIRWAGGEVNQRVLAMVSAGNGEGRSYVTANLAVAFSQLGERTLLIDADMRRPRQHQIFNVANRIGLSAVLSNRANGEAVVPIMEFGRLSLLPAGAPPPNPQELLSRARFSMLLHDLRSQYDVILIDTPPAALYADAQTVAFRAGNAIVLARKDHTRVADTKGVIRALSDAGANVIGTVFNAY